MNKIKQIIWQSLAWPSTVVHKNTITNQGVNGHGFVAGRSDKNIPFVIEYAISLTQEWEVEKFSIKSLLDQRAIDVILKDKKWYDSSGKHLAGFDNVKFLDISLTPFTNTLPIKQLQFDGDKQQKIEVIYFDEDKFALRKVKQLYRKVADNIYHYQDIEFPEFAENLVIDEEGFVIEYPQLFKRI